MHVDNVSTGLPKLICLLLIVLYTLPAPTPSTVEIIFKPYIIITPYFPFFFITIHAKYEK